jgi:beta-phosphoglucomutase-like phosphatase (HAD superfamily)
VSRESVAVERRTAPAPAVPPRVSTLLLDLDGTLVDTSYFDAAAWFLAFDDVGAHQPLWAIQRLIGRAGDDLVTELLGRPSERVIDAHARRFAGYLPSVRALPGARDLLDRCAAGGVRVEVVTSSSEDVAGDLLASLGGPGVVDDVDHAGMVDRATPYPGMLRVALDRAGASPDEALAIGDTVWDVEAATAEGVPCIGLQSGGTTRQALDEAGAIDVYAGARELVEDWSSVSRTGWSGPTQPDATLHPLERGGQRIRDMLPDG